MPGKLIVTGLRCWDLLDKDGVFFSGRNNLSDPFVRVTVNGSHAKCTQPLLNTDNPVFPDRLEIPADGSVVDVRVEVFDSDAPETRRGHEVAEDPAMNCGELLGRVRLQLQEGSGTKEEDLYPMGRIELAYELIAHGVTPLPGPCPPPCPVGGSIVIDGLRCRDLQDADGVFFSGRNNLSDPFVRVVVGKQAKCTRPLLNTSDPVFPDCLELCKPLAANEVEVRFEVFDSDAPETRRGHEDLADQVSKGDLIGRGVARVSGAGRKEIALHPTGRLEFRYDVAEAWVGPQNEGPLLPLPGVSTVWSSRSSSSADSNCPLRRQWQVKMDYIAHRTKRITRMEKYRAWPGETTEAGELVEAAA